MAVISDDLQRLDQALHGAGRRTARDLLGEPAPGPADMRAAKYAAPSGAIAFEHSGKRGLSQEKRIRL